MTIAGVLGGYAAAGALVALVNLLRGRGVVLAMVKGEPIRITRSMRVGRFVIDVVTWPAFVFLWIYGFAVGAHRLAIYTPPKISRKEWKKLKRRRKA